MDFNSQFSILNSVSRLAFFQPIAVLATARYCGAATTCSLLSPKTSNASSGSVAESASSSHAAAEASLGLSDGRFKQSDIAYTVTAAVGLDLVLMRFEDVIQGKKQHGLLLREFFESLGVF